MHRALVDERAFRVLRRSLATLQRRFEYVLAGGWAVYAHGSKVPSVDTDVFVRQRDYAAIHRALGSPDPREEAAQCELLALDRFNHVLGQDVAMGEPDLGYLPEDLLRGRTVSKALPLPEGALPAVVPEAPELAFMKLKAFYDRELAWRALRDPAVMARIPPEQKPEVREKTEAHYFRKAGKDLYDIAFLCAHRCDLAEALRIAEAAGLSEALTLLLRRAPRPLVRLAVDLAEDDASRHWLEAL